MVRWLPVIGFWCCFALLGPATARAQGTLPRYRNAAVPIDARVANLLHRMTLEEKFWQLFMIPGDLDQHDDYSHGVFGLQVPQPRGPIANNARADAERINAIQRYFVTQTRLGIPIIPFEEAVHGLRRTGATVFPQAIGLAATWDTALMTRVATVIAEEARSRGIRQVLSPVINIADDVRWGRVEETYGEDPWLTSAMARSFIAPLESAGIITTPKHFVANVGAGGRDSYPIDLDERALDERYFPPFRTAVVDAHARSVMAAYNSVDGVPASQNRWLLTGKLKHEWKFPGFVISDAAGTGGATVLHMTEASTATATRDALNAGLDVIFQSSYPQYRPYWIAFRSGGIADSTIDAAVRRVLRAKFQLGLFEHPYVDPDSAPQLNHSAAHRKLALEAAREAIVLLKNDRGALPIRRTIRSLAVIGVDAVEARLGGYSTSGDSVVSILDGLRNAAGSNIAVRYAPGPGRISPTYAVVPVTALS
ncbi:MAG: glycoside hydrolase family 3 protein, partial [Gemmatimonadales bacterium]